MTVFGPASRIQDLLRHGEARGAVEQVLPGLLDHPVMAMIGDRPLSLLADRHPDLAGDPARAQQLWTALAGFDEPVSLLIGQAVTGPHADYEDAGVSRGSAAVLLPEQASRWSPVEIVLAGPSHGNPFTEVELTAVVSDGTREQQVGGFYDGDGRWILRFLPEAAGAWTFTTSSTARSLDAISGTLTVAGAAEGEHGPVRADGFHFVHADGTRHLPLGTTAYAWIHQAAELREATLRTLEAAPFTKLRMCVFPKSFIYNTNEPELYPFPGAPGDGFDITRFDPGFFRHLEGAVAELGRRGVQADVILFHPYDRWGFAELGTAADDRYVRYLVRRLSAYPNVWWSMANEYDFIEGKTTEDWERLAKVVRDNDPVGHLMSIHNGPELYDHSRQWITHASIQRELYPAAEGILEWRQRWGKPVVVDECSYEGDLEYGWGNISGPELVRRFWDSAVRGGYAGHGETYRRPRDRIWWSKGGELTGEAPARIAFLRRILEQAPGPLEPLPSLDVPHAGAPGTYDLQYFGINRPSVRYLFLPSDRDHQVDIIDTWNMTITLVPGPHRGALTIDLPAREYMALRITTLPA